MSHAVLQIITDGKPQHDKCPIGEDYGAVDEKPQLQMV